MGKSGFNLFQSICWRNAEDGSASAISEICQYHEYSRSGMLKKLAQAVLVRWAQIHSKMELSVRGWSVITVADVVDAAATCGGYRAASFSETLQIGRDYLAVIRRRAPCQREKVSLLEI